MESGYCGKGIPGVQNVQITPHCGRRGARSGTENERNLDGTPDLQVTQRQRTQGIMHFRKQRKWRVEQNQSQFERFDLQ